MAGNLNLGNLINLLKPKNIEEVKGLVNAYSSFLSPEQQEKIGNLINELENPNGPNRENISNLTDSLKKDIDQSEAAEILQNENIPVPDRETVEAAMGDAPEEEGGKRKKRKKHHKKR
ncbi:MAG: hypothetical protein HFI72_03815 [Peptococcaceae bacterium]|jgi:hypothetical protein|nr:hypothetical protein [Peptococcaceae bacterium]